MRKYNHLTASKRGEIQALKAAGATLKQIADFIGCDTSTVCREIKRNGGPKRRELETVTDKELKEYQYKINSRPRAKLNFQSPKFVFYKEINKFALVT